MATTLDATTLDATTAATAGTATSGPRRVLWSAQVLLALFFLAAAAGPKLAGQQYAVEIFTQIGAGQWFRYLVGTLELLGAVGLLVPRWAGRAALGLAGVMAGAVLTQVVVLGTPIMALTPAVLGLVLGLIAWHHRPQATTTTR